MRITPNTPTPAPAAAPTAARTEGATPTRATFSVLNDFRYLTESDKELLRHATGEIVEPGLIDRRGEASAFTQQLALDRRTGELAPHQEVTSVYLRNAARALEEFGAGRPGFTNPYSGPTFERAVAWLDAHGRSRADLRM